MEVEKLKLILMNLEALKDIKKENHELEKMKLIILNILNMKAIKKGKCKPCNGFWIEKIYTVKCYYIRIISNRKIVFQYNVTDDKIEKNKISKRYEKKINNYLIEFDKLQ